MKASNNWSGIVLTSENEREKELLLKLFECLPAEAKTEDKGSWWTEDLPDGNIKLIAAET